MNPFKFAEAISTTKEDLLTPLNEKERKKFYNKYITNKSLSFQMDCIMYVNEVNQRPNIPNEWHFAYLLGTVRQKKRWLKWTKGAKDDFIDVIKETYGYNHKKACEALQILTIDQLEYLRKQLETGGLTKKKNEEKE